MRCISFVILIFSIAAPALANFPKIVCDNDGSDSGPVKVMNLDPHSWHVTKISPSLKDKVEFCCFLSDLRNPKISWLRVEDFNVIPLFGIDLAVLYRCNYSETTGNRTFETIILSREGMPAPVALKTVGILLTNFGITDQIDQSKCNLRLEELEKSMPDELGARGRRRLLRQPTPDYLESVLYDMCLAFATGIHEIQFCTEMYNEGRFNVNVND